LASYFPQGLSQEHLIVLPEDLFNDPQKNGHLTDLVSVATPLAVFLNRRARHVAIGTIDATITLLGLQHGPTAFAVIKILASIRWHGFCFLMTAFRAGDSRLKHDLVFNGHPKFS